MRCLKCECDMSLHIDGHCTNIEDQRRMIVCGCSQSVEKNDKKLAKFTMTKNKGRSRVGPRVVGV